MSYDEGLAQRVREQIEELPNFAEKKMFVGICFLLNGNMVCGVLNDYIIVRVGIDNYEALLKKPHTRKFDMTGKTMKGWVMVYAEGLESDDDLAGWLQKAIRYVKSLPSK